MVSLGEELKRAREMREISLREISDATKISVRILEAIENNNFKILPGGVFNRNFIRAYAGFIGLDPETTVRKYLQQASDVEETGAYNAMLSPDAPKTSPKKSKGVVILAVVVVLLLLIASYFLINRSRLLKAGGTAQLEFIRIDSTIISQGT